MIRRALTTIVATGLAVAGLGLGPAQADPTASEEAAELPRCGADLYVSTHERAVTGHDAQEITTAATVDDDCGFVVEGTIDDPLPAAGLLLPARAEAAVRIQDITDLAPGRYRYTITYRIDTVFVDHEPTTVLESGSITPSVEVSATYGPDRAGARPSLGTPDEGTFTRTLDLDVNQHDHVHAAVAVRVDAFNRGGQARFRIRGQVLSITRQPLAG